MQIVILNDGKKEIRDLSTLLTKAEEEYTGDGVQSLFPLLHIALNDMMTVVNANTIVDPLNYVITIDVDHTVVEFVSGHEPAGLTKFIYVYGNEV